MTERSDQPPACPCGGARVRVSTNAVYRCPDCGHTVFFRGGVWVERSTKSPCGSSRRRRENRAHQRVPRSLAKFEERSGIDLGLLSKLRT